MSGLEVLIPVAALGMKAAGTVMQGRGAQGEAYAHAAAQQQQAQIFQLEAQREREMAEERRKASLLESSARISRGVAAQGGQGVIGALGSPAAVTAAQERFALETAFGITAQGENEARVREMSAEGQRLQSRRTRQAGTSAFTSSLFSAFAGGVSDFAKLRTDAKARGDWF